MKKNNIESYCKNNFKNTDKISKDHKNLDLHLILQDNEYNKI
jgi:hypothetical protein